MPGAAPLHDVEGGVVEGDEGEPAGEAVLHELLGGHTAAQPTQQASRQINSLLMTLHSCYLLSIDDNFPIETRHSKDLLLKPMHSRLKINIWCTNVKDVYLVLRIYTD